MNKIKLSFLFLLILSLSFPIGAREELDLGLLLPGKSYDLQDIKQFFRDTHLTEQKKKALFLQAKQNYQTYQDLEEKLFHENIVATFREFAYYKVLKLHHDENNSNRYFQIKQSAFEKQVLDFETKRLKSYLDLGQGIQKAQEEFTKEELIGKHYPHKQGQNPHELYQIWYKAQRSRFKTSFFIEHAKQYALAQAIHHSGEKLKARSPFQRGNLLARMHIPALEVYDFYRNHQPHLEELMNRESLELSHLQQQLLMNPALKPFIQDLKSFSASRDSLQDFQEANLFNLTKNQLEQGLIQQFTRGDFFSKINKYLELAYERSQSLSSQDLETAKKNALTKFSLSNQGDYTNLTLAYIYEFAKSLNKVDHKAFQAKKRDLSQALSNMLKQLQIQLATSQFYLQEKRPFDYLVETFARGQLQNKSLNRSEIKLLAWLIKFEAKKVAHQVPIYVVIIPQEYSSREGQKAFKDYLRQEKYRAGKDLFREELRTQWQSRVQIAGRSSRQVLKGQSLRDFLFAAPASSH